MGVIPELDRMSRPPFPANMDNSSTVKHIPKKKCFDCRETLEEITGGHPRHSEEGPVPSEAQKMQFR